MIRDERRSIKRRSPHLEGDRVPISVFGRRSNAHLLVWMTIGGCRVAARIWVLGDDGGEEENEVRRRREALKTKSSGSDDAESDDADRGATTAVSSVPFSLCSDGDQQRQ
ncbi:hypothetical protein LWI29_017674 [Acer saccharum]|uniref:Uncharacterized protein n=1 Tax=Acer saccharum TaxID=4024 RepID=A0AA39SLQ6_ACESA|nr:hypothetical protein LWI29_017674 [Acer saccharum]